MATEKLRRTSKAVSLLQRCRRESKPNQLVTRLLTLGTGVGDNRCAAIPPLARPARRSGHQSSYRARPAASPRVVAGSSPLPPTRLGHRADTAHRAMMSTTPFRTVAVARTRRVRAAPRALQGDRVGAL